MVVVSVVVHGRSVVVMVGRVSPVYWRGVIHRRGSIVHRRGGAKEPESNVNVGLSLTRGDQIRGPHRQARQQRQLGKTLHVEVPFNER